jgi:hypothetical protein
VSHELRPAAGGAASRRRRGRRAGQALLWGWALFAALQGALVLAERRSPGLWQPQYAHKLALLHRRLAEAPGRPLVLLMGTSRTLNGLRPAELPPAGFGDPAPVVYNFACAGAGPLHQVLLLRRLLADGIHPQHVFLELLPALLAFDNEIGTMLGDKTILWRDLPALERHWHSPLQRHWWVGMNLLPCLAHRDALLAWLAPQVLSKAERRRFRPWPLDAGGYFPILLGGRVSGAECRSRLRHTREEYYHLLQDFHISPVANRAVRAFLDLCRAHGIGVTLVLMPESSAYRAWYAPHAAATLRHYLDGLCRDYRLRSIDARTWVADANFVDGHHLLPRGVSVLTGRFGREVSRLLRRQQADGYLSCRSSGRVCR